MVTNFMTDKPKQKRRGVMVGAYLPEEVKVYLEQRAKREFKTISQLLHQIVSEEMRRKKLGGKE